MGLRKKNPNLKPRFSSSVSSQSLCIPNALSSRLSPVLHGLGGPYAYLQAADVLLEYQFSAAA
jgi:hypothetical protein